MVEVDRRLAALLEDLVDDSDSVSTGDLPGVLVEKDEVVVVGVFGVEVDFAAGALSGGLEGEFPGTAKFREEFGAVVTLEEEELEFVGFEEGLGEGGVGRWWGGGISIDDC